MPIIRLGHSPDSDDAFMFYALATGKIDAGDLEFIHQLEDIETLNRRATRGELEVTALSIHAYAYVIETYALLASGASMGERYGPMVVAPRSLSLDELQRNTIAIPGTMTTAFLTLRLCLGEFPYVVVPFDRIIETVGRGQADAGLLIHEGQLTYAQSGLTKIIDLGQWWYDETGLPLPLGGNAVRKDLGDDTISRIARILRQSIAYGLEHREDALTHALGYARGMDRGLADRFVGMYVNEYTLDYGPRGREAVRTLLDRGARAGIIPEPKALEFV
ncbi:MAG: ABC transporter substrate-binding protein [Candidatus Latescibacteria bacterium]|nr:ABC transporter substrate-binding protein [Candidatus Latescibacterota bacterium]